MKHQNIWHLLKFITIFVLTLYLSGCASLGPTKPNNPYAGNAHPAVLNKLAQTNPLLVNELGKLPELQDDLSEKEMSALNNIVELYRNYPENFENVFNLMYQVGIPEIRKYCSPLQALFWIAEEGNVIALNDIVIAYSLEKLLNRAWIFKPSMFKSKNELLEIIAGINNDAKKIIYLMDLKYYDLAEMQAFLFIDYKNNPKMFSKKSRTKIEQGIAMGNLKSQWDNFDVVVERLNSPELLDYYERHALRYKYQRGYGEGPAQAKRVFKNKYGHCAQFTAFTVYILQKGGYEAHRYIVANPALKSPRGNYHRACLFMVKGKKYIMDNGSHSPIGIVRFEDYGDPKSRKEDAKLQDIPIL